VYDPSVLRSSYLFVVLLGRFHAGRYAAAAASLGQIDDYQLEKSRVRAWSGVAELGGE
jgi:hypothetical protein